MYQVSISTGAFAIIQIENCVRKVQNYNISLLIFPFCITSVLKLNLRTIL